MNLHLFCPENDLALARDIARYTPPPAASQLKTSGECLPLWFGADGDRFVSSGINARWLDSMQQTFGMDVQPWDYSDLALTPAPWGWSKASRLDFENLGFAASALPSDAALDRMRELSHRRTAAILNRLLLEAGMAVCDPAVEIMAIADLEPYMIATKRLIFKAPYSSSGRGIVPYDSSEFSRKLPQLAGIINRQGSVMVEPRHRRRSDFALLFTMADGKAHYRGLSLFNTLDSGAYTGNVLMPQDEIAARLAAESTEVDLAALAEATGRALEQIIGCDYTGPLGVDMMTLRDSGRVALAEVNLRNTMGHVCLNLYEHYITPGARGIFTITPAPPAGGAAEGGANGARTANGRMVSGTHRLNPPGTHFALTATLQ